MPRSLKDLSLNYSHALAGARATVDTPMLATAPRSVSPRPSTKDGSKHADLFLLSHAGTDRRAVSALLSSRQGSRATSPLLQRASLGHLCSVKAGEKVHLFFLYSASSESLEVWEWSGHSRHKSRVPVTKRVLVYSV